MDPYESTLREVVLSPNFRRATFAGVKRGELTPWIRATIRTIELRGAAHLQFCTFDERKSFTENHPVAEAAAALAKLLAVRFANVHLSTASEEIDLILSKKGKIQVSRRPGGTKSQPTHNREKGHALPEGSHDHLLQTMGILTESGQVRASLRGKFTQINEFLKHIQHLAKDCAFEELGRPVRILDCGCGSSYLTLAVHHYFNRVAKLPAEIVGVDVNEEVIRKSIAKSHELRTRNLVFQQGTIGEVNQPADIVIALHACDTATDDALAQAVRSEAKLILSVPCCQHHLNAQLKVGGASEVLRPLLRHGILHERTADLLTDSFRALALRILGYRVDIVEFVSQEHTQRNLMIRAVRTARVGEPTFVEEYRKLKEFWNVTPYCESVLGEPFQRQIQSRSDG
jgi:2-polyprenyl-3-methyl-5-hydroxy-6-metoxy-1,4-benzoquinol methylase